MVPIFGWRRALKIDPSSLCWVVLPPLAKKLNRWTHQSHVKRRFLSATKSLRRERCGLTPCCGKCPMRQRVIFWRPSAHSLHNSHTSFKRVVTTDRSAASRVPPELIILLCACAYARHPILSILRVPRAWREIPPHHLVVHVRESELLCWHPLHAWVGCRLSFPIQVSDRETSHIISDHY